MSTVTSANSSTAVGIFLVYKV